MVKIIGKVPTTILLKLLCEYNSTKDNKIYEKYNLSYTTLSRLINKKTERMTYINNLADKITCEKILD